MLCIFSIFKRKMDSILNAISNLFGVKISELILLSWMSYAMIAVGAIVAISLIFGNMKANYGRYAIGNRLPALDARIAWVIQEMPSFFIPFFFFIRAADLKLMQFLPLAMFITHYFHRFVSLKLIFSFCYFILLFYALFSSVFLARTDFMHN